MVFCHKSVSWIGMLNLWMNEDDSTRYLENNVKFGTEERKISCFSVLGNIEIYW